ncbi:hypothetical protein IVA93_34590 [Bradyrhizobium sp. 155]|uniref:hypothetical protein n=1 Tax=unclassified Bradyrhizobium TaxID=2631580 RepID=UPI001FF7BEE4|nr:MULTISPECIES: hypothetical protein [unclassified Bradyrhizobium]MCK1604987.1 hypothetical protein [Bradyrhizobium sp. 166]MCK1704506.1 hypothetical protein [Bradyrhizobium sp. 146]UPK11230.1 hypothetical protein IVA93_34590 [Bradyrhizobium sp. 155]
MQTILDHLDNIIRPAIRDYFAAEQALDAANAKGDAQAIANARLEMIRKVRTAAIELHHLADLVVNNPAPGATFADLTAARAAIRSVCVFARGTTAVQDTDLLRDAPDALKHVTVDRPSSNVESASAIVSIGNGYGEMRYGEQKYGGAEEVTVQTKDGSKYGLRWILHNSYDAWMQVLGQPQKPLGQI